MGQGVQAALPLNSLPSEGTLLICASGLSPWWLSHLLCSLPAHSWAAQSLGSRCPCATLCHSWAVSCVACICSTAVLPFMPAVLTAQPEITKSGVECLSAEGRPWPPCHMDQKKSQGLAPVSPGAGAASGCAGSGAHWGLSWAGPDLFLSPEREWQIPLMPELHLEVKGEMGLGRAGGAL